MIALVERDRRLGRRLQAALAARGCRAELVHSCRSGEALLGREVPEALYVSEMLHFASGGDLLATVDRDERLVALPILIRVIRSDSIFARAMRFSGARTMVAPVDVEAAASLLLELVGEDERYRPRPILLRAHELRGRAGRIRDRSVREQARTRALVEVTRKNAQRARAAVARAAWSDQC